ncbi:hypothetical protein HDU76_000243 [Blyttiomyces sp. JEL0837]|nr:hypothetical protein HDU76_000243 [Blyttiomyces sp. JEL0837]
MSSPSSSHDQHHHHPGKESSSASSSSSSTPSTSISSSSSVPVQQPHHHHITTTSPPPPLPPARLSSLNRPLLNILLLPPANTDHPSIPSSTSSSTPIISPIPEQQVTTEPAIMIMSHSQQEKEQERITLTQESLAMITGSASISHEIDSSLSTPPSSPPPVPTTTDELQNSSSNTVSTNQSTLEMNTPESNNELINDEELNPCKGEDTLQIEKDPLPGVSGGGEGEATTAPTDQSIVQVANATDNGTTPPTDTLRPTSTITLPDNLRPTSTLTLPLSTLDRTNPNRTSTMTLLPKPPTTNEKISDPENGPSNTTNTPSEPRRNRTRRTILAIIIVVLILGALTGVSIVLAMKFKGSLGSDSSALNPVVTAVTSNVATTVTSSTVIRASKTTTTSTLSPTSTTTGGGGGATPTPVNANLIPSLFNLVSGNDGYCAVTVQSNNGGGGVLGFASGKVGSDGNCLTFQRYDDKVTVWYNDKSKLCLGVMVPCNSSDPAQQIMFFSDSTIRPLSNPNVCFYEFPPPNGGTLSSMRLEQDGSCNPNDSRAVFGYYAL